MSDLELPPSDPLGAFEAWYAEAVRAKAPFADAMTLATASRQGRPSARMVLYKGLHEGRIGFVSNYDSRKGLELDDNPQAALVFFWPSLLRQVRFEGVVSRASAALSDAYFASRDRDSQLGAWASPQSRAIPSRDALTGALESATARFAGREVERPPNWGMYLLEPSVAELWISGPNRLHDRFVYERVAGAWQCQRLAP